MKFSVRRMYVIVALAMLLAVAAFDAGWPQNVHAADDGSRSGNAAAQSPEVKRRAGTEARKLSDTELQVLLLRLENELGSIQSMKSDFVQEKHLSIFTDAAIAKGALFFLRPDNVRFEIREPFQSVLIARHNAVAKYEFVDGKWVKLNLGAPYVVLMVTGQIATWLQGRFRDKSDIYELSAIAGAHTVVILTPRNEQIKKHIAAIELGLSEEKNRVNSVTIRESGGDYTHMTFSNQERDISLPDRTFDTTGSMPFEMVSQSGPSH